MPLAWARGTRSCVSPDDGKAYMYFERVYTASSVRGSHDDYTNFTAVSRRFSRTRASLVREAPAYFNSEGGTIWRLPENPAISESE